MKKSLRSFIRCLTGVYALAVLALMLVTVVDVGRRYLLGAVVEASYELTSILLGCIVFSGLVFAAWEQKHISLNVYRYHTRVEPAWNLRIILPVVSAVLVLFLLSIQLWQQAELLSESGEIFVVLGIPRAMIVYMMSIMTGCASFVTVIGYLAAVTKPSSN